MQPQKHACAHRQSMRYWLRSSPWESSRAWVQQAWSGSCHPHWQLTEKGKKKRQKKAQLSLTEITQQPLAITNWIAPVRGCSYGPGAASSVPGLFKFCLLGTVPGPGCGLHGAFSTEATSECVTVVTVAVVVVVVAGAAGARVQHGSHCPGICGPWDHGSHAPVCKRKLPLLVRWPSCVISHLLPRPLPLGSHSRFGMCFWSELPGSRGDTLQLNPGSKLWKAVSLNTQFRAMGLDLVTQMWRPTDQSGSQWQFSQTFWGWAS